MGTVKGNADWQILSPLTMDSNPQFAFKRTAGLITKWKDTCPDKSGCDSVMYTLKRFLAATAASKTLRTTLE